MDEARLTPDLGRLIDAAKTAAMRAEWYGSAPARTEGWALLAEDGRVHSGADPASMLRMVREDGVVSVGDVMAAAFAVAGRPGDTLLPGSDWESALNVLAPDTPVAVKYLGRWVVVALSELASLGEDPL
jgi:hypothetical protein